MWATLMRSPRSVPAGLAAASTAVLALAVLSRVVDEPAGGWSAGPLVVLVSVAVASLSSAAGMWCTNAFEARLAAVVLASLTGLGQVVAGTVGEAGLPGPMTGGVQSWGVVLLGVAVPVLVALDVRNAARNQPAEHPYAL